MKTNTPRIAIRVFTLAALVVLASSPSTRTIAGPKLTKPASSAEPTQARLAESYGKLPLSFEANRGQTDPRVKFLSRGSGYTLFLTSDEAVLALRSQEPAVRSPKSDAALSEAKGVRSQKSEGRPWSLVPSHLQRTRGSAPGTKDKGPGTNDVLRMKLVGANQAANVTALDELSGKTNYFIGNDPKTWRTDVPTYGKVKYAGVYPGIDLVYYGNQRQLEYDFVVAPGADPKAIQLAVVGAGLAPPDGMQGARAQQAAPLRIDASGDLVVQAEGGEVRFHKPVVYQPTADAANPKSKIQNRKLLDGRYALTADNQIHFDVSGYDKTKPLVIDPTLIYSTYLGGSGNDYPMPWPSGMGKDIAADSSGNAYVAGTTGSVDFPTLNAFQGTAGSDVGSGSTSEFCGTDAFVTKISAAGALVYSTYLGGSCTDSAEGVGVDASGSAVVAGNTGSLDFPTMNPFQPAYHGGSQPGCCDAFVTKLNSAGNALIYSTYLGGRFADQTNGMAVDSSGNAYVAGYTVSADFPTVNAIQPTCNNCNNPDSPVPTAFVAKFNPTGSPIYSTYWGAEVDYSSGSVAADSSGNAYLATVGFDISPTPGAFQTTSSGDVPYVTKFDATGSGLIYSTYLDLPNCPGNTRGNFGLALDSSGNAYLTSQGCLTKLNATGSALVYSTAMYDCSGRLPNLGIGGNAIAVDSAGNAYLAGAASSTCVNLVGAIQPSYGGGNLDAFVAKVDPTGTAVVFSTYLGGSGDDAASGIAVDSSGNAYVVGSTTSTDFPTVNAFQAANAGKTDTFVAKMSTPADTALRISSFTPTSGPVGTSVTINGAQYTGATRVAFNGTSATFTVVSDTQITATVPNGATKGPISVTNSSGTVTTSQAFMEVPVITSFSPTSGILGTKVTITGTSFTGATAVKFSGSPYSCPDYASSISATFTVVSDTQISTSVPSGATTGKLCVTNNGFTAASSSNFTVNGAAAPTISSFAPTSGTVGTIISITGSHFTGTTGVAINGGMAGLSVTSDTQLTATVQPGDTTGPITVTNSAGSATTSAKFTVQPSVYGFSPASGPAGTTLSISGSGLNGTTSVTFNSTPASFTVVSSTQINATVPAGATNTLQGAFYGAQPIYCWIVITTPAGTAFVRGPENSNGSSPLFEVLATAPPTITSFSPSSASPGSQITVYGTHLTGTYSVGFSGTPPSCDYPPCQQATYVGTSDSQLIVTVPSWAQTGPISVTNTMGSVTSSASLTVSGIIPPLAVVQVQNNINVSGTALTSLSVPITTTAGHLLVAFARESSNGTDNFTVTDSAGQTWTQTSSGYKNTSSSGPRSGMFYVANSAAVTSVTARYTTSGGVIKPGIMVFEISGAAMSGVADGSVNGGAAFATTTSTTGKLTTTTTDILVFATDTSGDETGWATGSGTIPNNKAMTGASGSNVRMAMEYMVSGPGSGGVASMTYTNSNWNGNIIAAFKKATAASGPVVQFSPSSLGFSNQTVGTTSAAQAVTLSNIGSATLTISSIAITGANSSDFAQTNTCGTSLAAGANCTINVTFTPSATGTRTAALTVTDNASDSPQNLSLSGTGASGAGSPAVSLSPPSLTFANQTVETTGAAQAVTLSNTGTAALNISSIAVTGTNSGDFGQTNNCGTSVAAGAQCTINVTFTPTASGTRTAALDITDNESGSPQAASLTGTGEAAGGSGPAFVQVQNNIDVSGAAFTTFSVPITTNPGDLLVAFVRESSNGADKFTVTDSAGQTWALTASGYKNESGTGPRVGMFYLANSAALTSVTAHFTTSGGAIKPGIMVMEISGAAATAVADGSVNGGTAALTTASTSGGLLTSNASDLLIFATDASGNESGWTAGSGYAIPNNKLMIGASGSNVRMAMQYAVVNSVQTYTTGMTYTNSNWNGNILAAFK